MAYLKSENDKESFKSSMLYDALLILESVGFVERELETKFSLLDEAINNNYASDVPIIEKQILNLLTKINDENRNMDLFMAKYNKEISHEKEAILSGVK